MSTRGSTACFRTADLIGKVDTLAGYPDRQTLAEEVERMTKSRWWVLLVLAAFFSMHGVECMAADAGPMGTSATAPASAVMTVRLP